MVSKRAFHNQVWDGTNHTSRRRSFKSNKKNSNQRLKDKAKRYLKMFLETSSIHGLNHLVAAGRHPLEIVLWLIMVGLSVCGSLYLSQTTWSRYQSSPTVISMDRDMFAWNTTFPCVTVCPYKKIDTKKLQDYLRNSSETNKTLLEAFIYAIANASYDNFGDIPKYDKIHPDDYESLMLNLSNVFAPTLTVGVTGVTMQIMPTITEMGLCYAVNCKAAVYNSPRYRQENRWGPVKSNRTLDIHPLDGEVFAQIVNISTGYNVFLHEPQEVLDIASRHYNSSEGFYMKLYVTAVTVYTSPEAAQLSIAQRRCRFPHENNLKHSSIYTYNMCKIECRIKLCLKYCQCIPYFYRKVGDEKICNSNGFHCLAKYSGSLYKLHDLDGNKINCDCYPLCDDVNYVLQSNTLQPWFMGTNLQWGMVTYPRMRFRREIIFGFTDVLVAVGGMAGLFLGCSVLSFMEIIYFLTLKLVFYARTHK